MGKRKLLFYVRNTPVAINFTYRGRLGRVEISTLGRKKVFVGDKDRRKYATVNIRTLEENPCNTG